MNFLRKVIELIKFIINLFVMRYKIERSYHPEILFAMGLQDAQYVEFEEISNK